MQVFPIDPVIFNLGFLQVRWYGLMYVIGFVLAGFLCRPLVDQGFLQIEKKRIDTLVSYVIVGTFIGARLAYVLIYNWDYYSLHLEEIFFVWQGGLSFHGAIVGIFFGIYFFSKKMRIPFFQALDTAALIGCQGLFWGRVGNFINGELYGRVTEVPWGIVFPGGGPYARHPSQLYEAVMEGIVLSIILWLVKRKVRIHGIITSIFFTGYGLFRYLVEFFREPDKQMGFYFVGTTTMGQILCILMIAFGIGFAVFVCKKNIPIPKEKGV
ncbi:MAG: prolipoprotein diacylglyceryl transferase [Halobacteriovoraceae bacterium]|nr:prolipoprotein diacylglyceryl transferase [Halobacteriovoraceae bacterium]